MDAEMGKRRLRLRARRDAVAAPTSVGATFRVVDQDGRTVQRIGAVRSAEEAMALFWRGSGAGLTEAMMDSALDRRIQRARGRLHDGLQTPELPFDLTASTAQTPTQRRPDKPSPLRPIVAQEDLFAKAQAKAHADANAGANAGAQNGTDPHGDGAADRHDAQSAPDAEDPDEPEQIPPIRILDPHSIMLARADQRNLRPGDRADSYLYHVTTAADAESALRQGLAVSPSDPVILTERQGVAYWLSVVAEDYDFIIDGPADFVVLRMRRHAIEDLLETDSIASRNAGCPCYVLTGGAGARAPQT